MSTHEGRHPKSDRVAPFAVRSVLVVAGFVGRVGFGGCEQLVELLCRDDHDDAAPSLRYVDRPAEFVRQVDDLPEGASFA